MGRRWVLICSTAASLALGLAVHPPAAAAELSETHAFNATLSVTGNCETSKNDPVADPSCPAEPPDGAFAEPYGVTIDQHGDLYYYGSKAQGGATHIYVFDASGRFLTELPTYGSVEHTRAVAVDGEGNLYLENGYPTTELYVLHPSRYEPALGEIAYANPPVAVGLGVASLGPLAVDNANGRVFVVTEPSASGSAMIGEIGAYAEGNPLLRKFGAGAVPFDRNVNMAIDARTERIYLSEKLPSESSASDSSVYPAGVRELTFEGKLTGTISSVTTAEGPHEFSSPFGQIGVAVDESTGHLFISDLENNPKPAVYELNGKGETVSVIMHNFQYTNSGNSIAVDNGVDSPNSAMNPSSPLVKEENSNGSYLFVPSGVQGTGHLYAFAPKPIPKAPAVSGETFSGVGTTEALLQATVDPRGLPTEYVFEYVAAATFEHDVEVLGAGHGFDSAVTAASGELTAQNGSMAISAALGALQPGTTYRFRVRAGNACNGAEAPACISYGEPVQFATYPATLLGPGNCPNEELRVGLTSTLPDCRAYELVTPTDTNGHSPRALDGNPAGDRFGTPPATAAGDVVGFMTLGGALPGFPGAGGFNGDPYVARRSDDGWRTESVGPSGYLSSNPVPGGFSPELEYMVFGTGPEDIGILARPGGANYVLKPDGSHQPVGEGSLATEPAAETHLISAGAGHTVFSTTSVGASALQLEAAAPPNGTPAIYDRTADGVVHVISLLPGDVTPSAGEGALYLGASTQGNAVAFNIGITTSSSLYVRLGDARTVQAAAAGATFEGLSADGRYLFYLLGGDLYRFDTEAEATTRITNGAGAVTVVNIPSQGTAAYFASTTVIAGAGKSATGARARVGQPNLYYWDGSTVQFVATLSTRDMDGEFTGGGGGTRDGLGLWARSISSGSTAVDPSRTTAGGGEIVFESDADLTGYDSGESSEIYRYDAGEASLTCLSCDPTGAPPTGDARLQTVDFSGEGAPTNPYSEIPSLSANGNRVFFESPDSLVQADTDGVLDVYEWEAAGEGSCETTGGCIFLISSGQGAQPSYLYGVSESGADVFIYTNDLLTAEDGDEAPSVYDARVDGGFPAEASRAAECLGEACQPGAVPLNDATPTSFTFGGKGNLRGQPPTHNRHQKTATCSSKSQRGGKSGSTRRVHAHNGKGSHRRGGSVGRGRPHGHQGKRRKGGGRCATTRHKGEPEGRGRPGHHRRPQRHAARESHAVPQKREGRAAR